MYNEYKEMQKQVVRYDSFDEVDLINDRDEQIKDLHNDMKEVKQLFDDINLLVHSQQDSVDNIQTQVEKTNQNIAKAVEELNKASENQKNDSCVLV